MERLKENVIQITYSAKYDVTANKKYNSCLLYVLQNRMASIKVDFG